MFDQFKENIRLAGETYNAARHGLKSGIESFKNAPRAKKGLWISIIGAIAVSSVASNFSVAWYYQAALVIGLVILPLWVWMERGDSTPSRR